MSLLTLLAILFVLSLFLGGWGSYRSGWNYYGWAPTVTIGAIFFVLWLTGRL
jgi:hypothetical protein